MAVRRFFATKDNTITNAFKEGLSTRGTGSNMGLADIVEVFNIYGQTTVAAATAVVTIVDTGGGGTSIDNLHGTNGFTITNTAGTALMYRFDKNSATSATGDLDGVKVIIGIQSLTTANQVAEQVEDAINSSNGHGSAGSATITVSRTNNAVTLTQVVPGIDGNVTIDPGSTPTPTYITFSGFTGGAGYPFEKSRALIQFDTSLVAASRSAGSIPASGSVDFYLKMSDAAHEESTPRQFTLTIAAVSQSWTEGTGLDMVNYSDKGYSNWESASSTAKWSQQGGTYLTGAMKTGGALMHTSQYFKNGTENLEVNVTQMVEEWIKEDTGSYGFGIMLTSSLETGSTSYYTKKFFARDSEFFHKRPYLEARWNDSISDDSSDFYLSSSRAPESDNLNKIYLYNYIRGQLVNIPSIGTGNIYLSVYSGSTGPTGNSLQLPKGGGVITKNDMVVTGAYDSTGIYSASFAYTNSSVTSIYPVWHNRAAGPTTVYDFYTGSAITVKNFDNASAYPTPNWVININNLQTVYSRDEVARFRLYVRPKNWNPNLYTVAQTQIETTPIKKAYYQLTRDVDNAIIIPYGTGSGNESFTQLSYDISGNYFDLDMSMLQSGYTYQLSFLFNLVGNYSANKTKFKFRVSDGD